MEDNEIESIPKFKMIFLGNQSTGKSSILHRYLNNQFSDIYQPTVGLDFQSKNITLGENRDDVRLILYDTAGQEKFKSLIPNYIRDAQIVLFVYDVTRPETFEDINKWLVDVLNIRSDDAIFALVGNKMDLQEERKVTFEEGKKFADEKSMIFEEVSAKTGENFESLFEGKLYGEIKEKLKTTKYKEREKEEEQDNKPVDLKSSLGIPKPEKKRCC